MGDANQRQFILDRLRGKLANMACDTYGSHVVQKALELVPEFAASIIDE